MIRDFNEDTLLPLIENTFLKPTVRTFLYRNIPKISFHLKFSTENIPRPIFFLKKNMALCCVFNAKRYFITQLTSVREETAKITMT